MNMNLVKENLVFETNRIKKNGDLEGGVTKPPQGVTNAWAMRMPNHQLAYRF